MQDKYVADVGGLWQVLTFLLPVHHKESSIDGKELAKIWFMQEDEGEENNDGQHRNEAWYV